MNRRIIPLIMCGGAGTRLWPASREVRPKQFLHLFGPRSTFQDTMMRVSDAALFERPIVITNAAYRFMVLEQLAEIGIEADILLEPMRRDSGRRLRPVRPLRRCRDGDAMVLALAADHVVRDTAAFVAACRQGLAAAEAGRIVTFGVAPERAATEYGYIKPGEAISGEVRSVAKFVEKPDPATAAGYIKSGYLWNSGNFMFRAVGLARRIPQRRCRQRAGRRRLRSTRAGRDLGFVTLDRACVRIGQGDLDRLCGHGKDRARAVVPVPSAGPMSAPGTRCGTCPTRTRRAMPRGATRCSKIRATATSRPTARWSALEGVDDLVVVATQDAVLVSRQQDANGLKRLVAKLKRSRPR